MTVENGIFHHGTGLDDAVFEENGVFNNRALFDARAAEENGVLHGAADDAAGGDEGIGNLGAVHVLGGNCVTHLGDDGTLAAEELVIDAGAQEIHAVGIVRTDIGDQCAVTLELVGENHHLVIVVCDDLEQIKVVDGTVPLNELEQQVAACNEAVEELNVAALYAVADLYADDLVILFY